MNDARLTLARPDLAAASLEGVARAAAYRATRTLAVVAPRAPLRREPGARAELLDEVLFGETFDVLDTVGDHAWGQARRDGYVGFVPTVALAAPGSAPTHRVAALAAYAFAGPSFKAAATGPFSLNALMTVMGEQDAYIEAAGVGWFRREHLAPIGVFESDPATVAERFVGAPYLWGGRTSAGIDCSGLVQQALYACGRAFPRDNDQQLAAAREIERADLTRGDLVGWPGHIGMMLDGTRLIHANSHHMATVIEPVDEAIERIEALRGERAVFRRI